VSALYDVFNLNYQTKQILIDATGVFGDYVSVAFDSILMVFRQYEIPVLVFEDSFQDFNFSLTYTNRPDGSERVLSNSTVFVANYPQDLGIMDQKLKNDKFLDNQINYQNKTKRYEFNDTTWFTGAILNYSMQGCSECGHKIRVINHIEHKRVFHSTSDMEDYAFTPEGGVVQQFQTLITMRHNGSINQFVEFPSILIGEYCYHVSFNWRYNFVVSSCHDQGEVFLYMTSLVNEKPFVSGPFTSSARRAAGIQNMGELIFVIDVDEEPSVLAR
jgi:hypothetical protein